MPVPGTWQAPPLAIRRRMPGMRATAAFLILAIPAVAAAEGPADGLGLPGGPPRTPEFKKKVNTAIERGVDWLRRQQKPDGSFGMVGNLAMFRIQGADSLGASALGIYTLRACGAGRDDPAVLSGLQRLREQYLTAKARPGALDNYGVSITVLALEAHYAAEELPPAGGDRYGKPSPGGRRIPGADLGWLKELTRWLEAAQTKDGGFSYMSPAHGTIHDHSNMQYSLLALKAARRCGLEVRREIWERSMLHLLSQQEKRGPEVGRFEAAGVDEHGYGAGSLREVARDTARGWGYYDGSAATGSMTSGGVSSLVICRSELLGLKGYSERRDAEALRGIRDGLAWLGRQFTVEENPGPANAPAFKEMWQYYYLYGLERAGVLSGAAWMGRHDWYLEGAEYLVEQQRDGGSWLSERQMLVPGMPAAGGSAPGSNYLDTCFALLFLKRATFRVDRGSVATESSDGALDLAGAATLDEASFASVFGAVFARYRRASPEDRAARVADFVRLGTRAIPLLVLHLEDEAVADRSAAIDALERTTGERRGYAADAPAGERSAAVARWEEWWFGSRDSLAPDVATGRFVASAVAPAGAPR